MFKKVDHSHFSFSMTIALAIHIVSFYAIAAKDDSPSLSSSIPYSLLPMRLSPLSFTSMRLYFNSAMFRNK